MALWETLFSPENQTNVDIQWNPANTNIIITKCTKTEMSLFTYSKIYMYHRTSCAHPYQQKFYKIVFRYTTFDIYYNFRAYLLLLKSDTKLSQNDKMISTQRQGTCQSRESPLAVFIFHNSLNSMHVRSPTSWISTSLNYKINKIYIHLILQNIFTSIFNYSFFHLRSLIFLFFTTLTVWRNVNFIGQLSDVHFKSFLDLIKYFCIRFIRYEGNSQSLCSKSTSTCHLEIQKSKQRSLDWFTVRCFYIQIKNIFFLTRYRQHQSLAVKYSAWTYNLWAVFAWSLCFMLSYLKTVLVAF